MTELKPCPFCGSGDIRIAEDCGCFVPHCKNCGAEGPDRLTEAEAIAAWNERAEGLAAEALAILMRMIDAEECRYDHNGLCQEHWLHPRPCPNEEARALLANARRQGMTQ